MLEKMTKTKAYQLVITVEKHKKMTVKIIAQPVIIAIIWGQLAQSVMAPILQFKKIDLINII